MPFSSFALSYDFLANPLNLVLQVILAVAIAYFLLFRRSSSKSSDVDPQVCNVGSFESRLVIMIIMQLLEERLAEWNPEPLPTRLTRSQERNMKEHVVSQYAFSCFLSAETDYNINLD